MTHFDAPGSLPDIDIPPEFNLAMSRFWRRAMELIVQGCNFHAYVEAMRDEHAKIVKYTDGFTEWPQALILARTLWKHTPQPALDYANASLPEPERNASCPCGSGRKYKHCCLLLAQSMPAPDANWLPLLLQTLPKKRWPELAESRVSIAVVAAAAYEFHENRDPASVITLLEPWFRQDGDFIGKREMLLDALLDAYGDAGNLRKKERLLERAIKVGDNVMRSDALQRQASMLTDQRDFAGAWRAFTQAQRANPNAVSLSHLEVTILQSEGRADEARERARFWIKRFEAMRDPELADLIALLRDLGERGMAAMADRMLNAEPDLANLREALRNAPPVACLYTLDPGEEECGPLRPTPVLRQALAAWTGASATVAHSPLTTLMQDAADGLGDIEDWLPVLIEHPELWNAFEMHDAMFAALRDEYGEIFMQAWALPLLDRVERLLHEVLRANHSEGRRFEWGWLENRPALHLLGERIAMDMDKPADAAQLARLEWIVLILNPNDNQGFRDVLMRAYLHAGRIDDALALSDRYPDDFAAMQYNRALALFAANRRDDALAVLHNAVKDAPKLLAWLLKANAKPPASGRFGIQVGGDEEAWLYRLHTLELWRKLGALDWLRECARVLKKRR
jgi:tetratricopeptide (TPR) repeat protein